MLATRAFVGNALATRPVLAMTPKRGHFVIQNAHKQGAGSTKNGRDSNAQRRGVKVYGSQEVKAGGIIVRQVGSTWYPGDNCGQGKDFTIYSTTTGVVVYDKKKYKPEVNVYPADHPLAIAALAKTHTTQAKEGVPSRAERRKSQYTTRSKAAGSTLSIAKVTVDVKP